jgi:RNA-directed DNA polymerase
VIDVSLQTPLNIRRFQRKLYTKAKQEPSYRFYCLYDKICREDILAHAYEMAKANGGAPGMDRESFDSIESGGRGRWLAAVRKELIEQTYRPEPVRRVMIPKPGGGERPLGIPNIRDRVVQTATKLVIEPIFEADLEPNAYGYRPKRSARDAVQKVHQLLRVGYTDVVDADLSKYFDTIPHAELLNSVARRIVDRRMLRLIKMWLTAPVMQRDEEGTWHNTGRNRKGTPQGGVISPLLANLYMNRFLKYWRLQGKGEEWRAEIVAYADDFVILSRGNAAEARMWTQKVMTRIGLTLNEQKTSIRDARTEHFDFLGYTFGPQYWWKTGRKFLAAQPSKKSLKRLRTSVYELLRPHDTRPWELVRADLNARLRGWQNYFSYGAVARPYATVNRYVYDRVRYFLRRRHTTTHSRGTRQFSNDVVFGRLGVYSLRPH